MFGVWHVGAYRDGSMTRQFAGLFAGAALLVLLVSACGDDDDGQPAAASVGPADLAGTKWVLSSYVADDEDVDAAAVAALDFGADGTTLSGTTGCNSVGGTYTQDGSNLTIKLGPMTLVACTDDATPPRNGRLSRDCPVWCRSHKRANSPCSTTRAPQS